MSERRLKQELHTNTNRRSELRANTGETAVARCRLVNRSAADLDKPFFCISLYDARPARQNVTHYRAEGGSCLSIIRKGKS